jgi:hypothetical protein
VTRSVPIPERQEGEKVWCAPSEEP